MTAMTFYEKPGCINGEKQKRILRDAGHTLTCINILMHPWTRDELFSFVRYKTPTECMNFTAPDIKNGTIVPEKLTFDQALALMVMHPILIRRPLIMVDGNYIQGFNDTRLEPYLGTWEGAEDVITCPNLRSLSCDELKS